MTIKKFEAFNIYKDAHESRAFLRMGIALCAFADEWANAVDAYEPRMIDLDETIKAFADIKAACDGRNELFESPETDPDESPYHNTYMRSCAYARAYGAACGKLDHIEAIARWMSRRLDDSRPAPNLAGAEILDVCPLYKMPEGYTEHAEHVIRTVELRNGRGIVALAHEVLKIPATEPLEKHNAEEFGRFLYSSVVGNPGLEDEYGEDGSIVKIPDIDSPLLVTTGNVADYF